MQELKRLQKVLKNAIERIDSEYKEEENRAIFHYQTGLKGALKLVEQEIEFKNEIN